MYDQKNAAEPQNVQKEQLCLTKKILPNLLETRLMETLSTI